MKTTKGAILILLVVLYGVPTLAREIYTARDLSDEDCQESTDCSNEELSDCAENPCLEATCPAFPDAECRPNYCEGCNTDWYTTEKPIRLVNCQLSPEELFPCPPQWRRHDDACYFFNDREAMNQANAALYCQRLGGHLVSINSREEQEFILEFPLDRSWTYWTAGTRRNRKWIWDDGEDTEISGYTNWNKGEPNTRTEEGLALKGRHGTPWGWKDTTTDHLFYFLCEADASMVKTLCASDPCMNGGTCVEEGATYNCTCPTGFSGTYCQIDGDDTKWYPFEGHTYQVFGEVGRPRDDGSVVCEENQAYLVSFNSSAEVRFIERILRKNDYERPALWWYIGAYIDAGEWRWEDGSSFGDGPTYWNRGEPNNYKGEEKYVEMTLYRRRQVWNDISGVGPRGVICERNRW